MRTGEAVFERSRSVGDLQHTRLMALLGELVRDKGPREAAQALGVDHRTLAASLEGGRLSRRLRVALEKALLSGGGSAAAEQQEHNEVPLSAVEIETVCDGEEVLVAGWPVARQHPKGRDGTVFVTVKDETGGLQLILWPQVFARCRRELGARCSWSRASSPGGTGPPTSSTLT